MENLGYYNGKFGPLNEMSIPMNDRVHWFGDGVYDAGPARNYKIFAIDEHIDRFFNSAELLEIEMPCTKQELKDLLNKLVKKVDTGSQFVYYQVTRGTGIRDHAFTEGPGNLWVMLKPATISDGIEPIKLITEPDTRFFHCNIKTLNLIPSVMASEKAKRAGCQETVFYREGGRVTECAHSNVHIIKCARLGISVHEEPYYLEDLFAAEEVLVTSSSNLCLHAHEIDGKPVGGMQSELIEALRKEVIGEFLSATEAD